MEYKEILTKIANEQINHLIKMLEKYENMDKDYIKGYIDACFEYKIITREEKEKFIERVDGYEI